MWAVSSACHRDKGSNVIDYIPPCAVPCETSPVADRKYKGSVGSYGYRINVAARRAPCADVPLPLFSSRWSSKTIVTLLPADGVPMEPPWKPQEGVLWSGVRSPYRTCLKTHRQATTGRESAMESTPFPAWFPENHFLRLSVGVKAGSVKGGSQKITEGPRSGNRYF